MQYFDDAPRGQGSSPNENELNAKSFASDDRRESDDGRETFQTVEECSGRIIAAFTGDSIDYINNIRNMLDAPFCSDLVNDRERIVIISALADAIKAAVDLEVGERTLGYLFEAISQIVDFEEVRDPILQGARMLLGMRVVELLETQAEWMGYCSTESSLCLRELLYHISERFMGDESFRQSTISDRLSHCLIQELASIQRMFGSDKTNDSIEPVYFDFCQTIAVCCASLRNSKFDQPLSELFSAIVEYGDLQYLTEGEETEEDESSFSDSLGLVWREPDDDDSYDEDGEDFDDESLDDQGAPSVTMLNDGRMYQISESDNDTPVEALIEGAGIAVLRALALCQKGDLRVSLWKDILENTDIEGEEWIIALVGLSSREPAYLRPFISDLLTKAAEYELRYQPVSEDDSPLTQHFVALIDLTSVNPDMFDLVEECLRDMNSRQQRSLARVCRHALDNGEIAVSEWNFDNVINESLEDKFAGVFLTSK